MTHTHTHTSETDFVYIPYDVITEVFGLISTVLLFAFYCHVCSMFLFVNLHFAFPRSFGSVIFNFSIFPFLIWKLNIFSFFQCYSKKKKQNNSAPFINQHGVNLFFRQ